MFIEVLRRDDVCVVRVQGRFTSGSQLKYLEEKLLEIRSLRASSVIADFHRVDSIGSTGLSFIVRVFQSATERPGGRFLLAGANPRVRRALDVTRLSEIIPMADDLNSGLGALRSN